MTVQPPSTRRAPSGRRRAWLAGVVALWAVALVGLAYLSARHGAPSVRDQRGIGEARPIVDRAVGELTVAAGSDVVLRLSGYEVTSGCRITAVRSGQTLRREVTAYTREADAPALLDRIADRLPDGYAARTRHTEKGDSLRADAGEFVSVRGTVSAPGVVSLTVDTGCRPAGGLPPPPRADPAVVTPVMAGLDVPLGDVSAAEAPCPSGGVVRSVLATAEGAPRPFTPPAGATVVLRNSDVTAYRLGAQSTSITFDGERVDVTVTTSCP